MCLKYMPKHIVAQHNLRAPLRSRRWVLRALGVLGLGFGAWPRVRVMANDWMNSTNLSGRSKTHIKFLPMIKEDATHGMLPETHAAFLRLAEDAKKQGIRLRIASAFRDFDRQQLIWDQKAYGKRRIYDGAGKPLQHALLDDKALVFAILRWNALPGMSRHHWGTDIDVYDGKALAAGARVKLDEEESRGVFGKLHGWLDQRIMADQAHGFYRPYDGRGSVGAELWHLSYKPVAMHIARYLTKSRVRQVIADSNIALRKTILDNFDEIYAGYMAAYID